VDEETNLEYAKVYAVFRELGSDLKDLIKSLALAKKANYKPEELPDIISSIEKEVREAVSAARARMTRKENEKSAA
jgi:sugar-specific transcriptional regulator TrmB